MKKKELKEKLEVATKALELYREYMIDGKLYAAEALDTMDWVHTKHIKPVVILVDPIKNIVKDVLKEGELRKEVEQIINDILKRNLSL